jgi:hypothetical protein
MAFGAVRGTLSGNNTSPTTGINATGSVAVTKGDLICVSYALRTTGAVTITDNLGNGYHQLPQTDSVGNSPPRAFWAYANANGTLTTATSSHATTTGDAAFAVAVFEGPFDPWTLDQKELPSAADTVSPYPGANTGTLSQADELIVGFQGQGNGSAAAGNYGATSPYAVAAAASSGTGANTSSACIISHVVSSTTGEAPEVTSTVSTSSSVITASFRKARSSFVTGDCIGLFVGSSISGASGSIIVRGQATVAVGDVVVLSWGAIEASGPTLTGVSDNLGNTYTLPTGLVDGSANSCRAAWTIVTTAGELTSLTATRSSTVQTVIVAAAFKGPATALDKDITPVQVSGTTLNYPTTGTLAQASELVVGYSGDHSGRLNTAASGQLLAVESYCGNTTGGQGANIVFDLVAATTAVVISTTPHNSSLTVAGVLTFKITPGPAQGSATLVGDSALTASARLIAQTSATLSGAGAISATANLIERTSATLAGTGALAVDAQAQRPATATLSGAGALVADARRFVPASATLPGAGALSIDARAARAAAATLGGAGALTANATVVSGSVTQQASATLVGDSALTADADIAFSAAASLAGVGALSVTANIIARTSATLTGAGSLTVDTDVIALTSAVLSGASSLTIDARAARAATATLTGAGNLSVSANLIAQAGATLAGSGVLVADARRVTPATATLAGTGALIIDARRATFASATLAGSGVLVADATVVSGGVIQQASASLAGVGALSISANIIAQTSATLGGTGALIVDVDVIALTSAILSGAGSLTIDARAARAATATLSGAGALTVDARAARPATATLSGAGALSANANVIAQTSAVLAGAGALIADARASRAASATLSGAGSLSANATVIAQQPTLATRPSNLSKPPIARLSDAVWFNCADR